MEPSMRDPRVLLAAERTLLAWIRTGLAIMAFGFVVARFSLLLHEVGAVSASHPPNSGAAWTGVALVGCGIAVNVAVAVRYRAIARALARDERPELSLTPGVRLAVASGLGGVLLVGVLALALVR